MIVNRIVEIILLVMALGGILCILLATVYDLKASANQKRLDVVAKRVLHRRKPTVTILLYGSLSTSQVLRCTNSIRRSSYRAVDYVAIVSPGVSFNEKQKLHETMHNLGGRAYTPRKKYNPEQLLRNAFQRSKKGDYVLIVCADDQANPLMIGHSVAHLETNPTLDGVRFAQSTVIVSSLLELTSTFAVLSRKMFTKALDVVRIRNGRLSTSGLYHRTVLLRQKTPRKKRAFVYNAKTAVAHAQMIHPRWQVWKAAFQAVFLVLFGYSAVLAATLQSATPLVLSWLIVGLWLVAVVWSDDATRQANKIALSLCVPVGYFVVVGALAVNGAASIVRRPSAKSFYIL